MSRPLKKAGITALGVAAVLVALGLPGCSDNNPTAEVPEEVQFAEVLITALLEDAIVPLVYGISVPIQDNLPAVLGGSSAVQCTPLGCKRGTGDLCQTGVERYFARYDRCKTDDDLLMNGSLLLEGNSSAATWTADLDINGARMNGTATQQQARSCTDTSFSDFQVSAPGFFGFLGGRYEYCGGRWFSGRITVDAEVFGAGDFVVVLKFDDTAQGTANVSFSDGVKFANCTTDLRTGSATCS